MPPTLLQRAQRYVTSKIRGENIYKAGTMYDEHLRMVHFKRLWDYYKFNREDIYEHVNSAMKHTYKDETRAKMQFALYNLTRKITDRLAVAYLVPAYRYIIDSKKDNKLYQEILSTSNINSSAKEWNRQAKVFDTAHVGVMFRDGRCEYEILPPHALHIEPSQNNYLNPEKVIYDQSFGEEVYTVIWTADEYRIVDEHNKLVEGLNPWNGKNRYGIVPWLPCRLSIPENYWGEGDTELVDINEKVNIAIANMFYNLIMQSHGQGVAVNMNLDSEFSIGPDYTIAVDNVREGDVVPSFEYKHPDPATVNSIKAIDWMIKEAAVMKGLSAQSMNTEISDRQSGIAKGIDLAELRERRQDDIEFLRPFEKRLFEITKRVWNVNNPTNQLSEKAALGIDFLEPELPMSQMEEMQVKEFKRRHHLWTPVDDFIDEDEGIDKMKALDQLLENKEINELLGFGGVNDRTTETGGEEEAGEGGEEEAV